MNMEYYIYFSQTKTRKIFELVQFIYKNVRFTKLDKSYLSRVKRQFREKHI